MKFTIHAGHNPRGKIACGASDYIDESTEARYIVKWVKHYVKQDKIKIYDCTVNNGKSQNDVLNKIISKCAKYIRDMDISIHFNSFKHSTKDAKTKGVEVHCYSEDNELTNKMAEDICKEIAKLGFTNRGVKYSKNLYFLRSFKTKNAMLIECCFVDDYDDAALYKKKKKEVAQAIARVLKRYGK